MEPLVAGTDSESLGAGSWSPDGAAFAYQKRNPITKSDIWILPREGGEPFPFADTEFDEVAPVFSPNGRFIAYVSDESGQNEVYVQPYPGPGEKHLVSTDGGTEPVWSDGQELFYRHGDEMLVVDIELEPELRLGQPKVLFQGTFSPSIAGPANYDVSPDGQRFIMVERSEHDAPTQFNVILNWFDELERLVPTN